MSVRISPIKRINVIGTSGSGKSHFSRRLADELGYPYIEMDAVFWQPNWEHLTTEDFLLKLQGLMEQDTWVLDGNQSKTHSLKLQYVDTIVWLDFSFWRTFSRILARSINRATSKEEIWVGTGNRESFRRNFFSKESVVLWMLQSFWRNKQNYTTLFASELTEKINLVRLKSPKQAEMFLTEIRKSSHRQATWD
jgi:adenylate kinase family enzyme